MQLKVTKELSIADFLAMDGFTVFGKSHDDRVFFESGFFSIRKAGLTSLAGIDLVQDKQSIEACNININNNYILDELCDSYSKNSICRL